MINSGLSLSQLELEQHGFLEILLTQIRSTVVPADQTKTGKILFDSNGNNLAQIGIYQYEKMNNQLVYVMQPDIHGEWTVTP